MSLPILFSFRRCPYAMRARWAILNCGLDVIIREVSLKDKPLELIQASSKATVPVLIQSNGEVIDESVNIISWALKNSPKKNILQKSNANKNKAINMIIQKNDKLFKYHLDRYKYSNRYQGIDHEIHKKKSKAILKEWDQTIKNSSKNTGSFWLLEGKQTIADWCIWPFVRQYRLVNPIEFDNDNDLTNIRNWLNYFLESKLFPILMTKYKFWKNTDQSVYFPKSSMNK